MKSQIIEPLYKSSVNQKIGLIVLATDFMIERDFINITKKLNLDIFVNRIHCYFPLTKNNLIKMSNAVTQVSKDILPGEKLNCVVYGCTSGTIAASYKSIKEKIKLAKPDAQVITPSTAAINALKKLGVKKVSIFTPYSKNLNDDVINYFKKENFVVTANSYFNILNDSDIAKIDQDYLYKVLSKIDMRGSEALFISCTNLPALPIIDKLEKKLGKIVLSSNQVLIWDTLRCIGKNNNIKGFGRLFSNI